MLPAGWGAATAMARPLFSGGDDIKTLLPPLLLTCFATCFDCHHSGPSITAAANVLDFPPGACCMRGLPLSRTVRALLPPPPSPTPVKLSLSDKGGEFPRTHNSPHLPALQNRTYASQPVLNANIISKFFPSLYSVGKIGTGGSFIKLAAP